MVCGPVTDGRHALPPRQRPSAFADPDLWRPLIMSFQKFYGLGPQREPSVLAQVPERLYLTPDHAPARIQA